MKKLKKLNKRNHLKVQSLEAYNACNNGICHCGANSTAASFNHPSLQRNIVTAGPGAPC